VNRKKSVKYSMSRLFFFDCSVIFTHIFRPYITLVKCYYGFDLVRLSETI